MTMQASENAYVDARPPLLEVTDAVVKRAGRAILSVDKFILAEGENIALLGPNGAGKSTFVNLITREVMPLYRDVPPVRFKGNARPTVADVKQCVGVVSSAMQYRITVHLPVRDIVAGGLYGALSIPKRAEGVDEAYARAQEALAMIGIADLAERDIMTLSTGQARRALIARALVHNPTTLVFDEPCTGLDPEGMYYVRSTMRKLAGEGTGIVLVTHYPEDVIPEIKRLVLIKDGKLFADGAKEDLFTDGVMSDLFDVPLQVRRMVASGKEADKTQENSQNDTPEETYFSLVSTY